MDISSDAQAYLAKLKPAEMAEFQRLQKVVLRLAPDAQLGISYGMPGFKYNGKYLIAFAAFKRHLSIFPGAEAVETFKDQLASYKTSKGTIQFTADNPLPTRLIEDIVVAGIQRINNA